MLLSKRPEMFLPEKWPAYYSKAKGCKVWDLDGNEFIDMSIMGIGTNILGYGHPEVDEAVRRTIQNGNMSTLNCPEEVSLAEKMIDIHHTIEIAYVLVISMWGNTGQDWQYIGNQIVLQQPMTLDQCEYLISETMWQAFYNNEYYKLMAHCYPED